MIKLLNVCKQYRASEELVNAFSLKNINLTVQSNSFTSILGQSGCGKTTLLNIIGCIDSPDSGEIYFKEEKIDYHSQKQLDNYRKNKIGFIFQNFNLLSDFTVEENIKLSLELNGEKIENDDLLKVLNECDLFKLRNRKIGELSGGEKQRVAIARALIKKPEIILCDEPTGSLDSVSAANIFNLLKKLTQYSTILIVTHDKESAKKYSDYIIEMSDGRIESNKANVKHDYSVNTLRKENKNPLPSLYAKLAVRNLKRRPFRLIAATLVSVFALSPIGLIKSISLETNEYKLIKNQIKDNVPYLQIKNIGYYDTDSGEEEKQFLSFHNNEIIEINNEINGDLFPIYNICLSGKMFSDAHYHSSGIFEINEALLNKLNFSLEKGVLPKNENEIALSMYSIAKFSNTKTIDSETVDSFIGRQIELSNNYNKNEQFYTVTAIIDTKIKMNEKSFKDEGLSLLYGIHNAVFMCEGFVDSFLQKDDLSLSTKINIDSKITLTDVVSLQNNIVSSALIKGSGNVYGGLSFFKALDKERTQKAIREMLHENNLSIWPYEGNTFDEYFKDIEVVNRESIDYKKLLSDFCKHFFESEEHFEIQVGSLGKRSLVGAFLDKQSTNQIQIGIDIDAWNFMRNAVSEEDDRYGFINTYLLPFSSSKEANSILLKLENISFLNEYKYHGSDTFRTFLYSNLEVYSEYSQGVNESNDYITFISMISIIVSIVFGVALLLITYIYYDGLVIDKSKDVGILRCLGFKKRDILLIFIIQSILVAIMNTVLSSFGTVILMNLCEKFSNIDFLFSYNIGVVALIGLVAFIVSLICLIFPINKLLKERPVDIVRNNE